MKNMQVRVDEQTLRQVDRLSKPLGLRRSAIVRQALRQWLQRRATERFEEDWIAAAKRRSAGQGEADEWLAVQAWSRKMNRTCKPSGAS